jgi:leader peptidase (prepilin peptidase)/N-methyltransferase
VKPLHSDWPAFADVLLRRRLLLVTLMPTVTGLLVLRFGGHPALVPNVFVLGVLGPVLSVLDGALHRLPDRIVLPAIPLTLFLLATSAAIEHEGAPLARALLGGTLASTCFVVLALASRGDLGWGDVKVGGGLLAPLLAWTGWWTLMDGGLIAFAAASVTAHAGFLQAGGGRRRIALGPYLFAGALAALLISGPGHP